MPLKIPRLFSKIRQTGQPGLDKDNIVIVSGLPRSGTSMMMKILEAGGILPLTDKIREADIDNPKGYYEFERVKQLDKGDVGWLPDARGKSVKVIAALLQHLPPGYTYKIVFMRREIEEILRSQQKMLERRGQPTDKVSEEELAELFHKHLANITTWLAQQPNFDVLYVSYNAVMTDPQDHLEEVNNFLGGQLDLEKMVAVIDPKLYRQRA